MDESGQVTGALHPGFVFEYKGMQDMMSGSSHTIDMYYPQVVSGKEPREHEATSPPKNESHCILETSLKSKRIDKVTTSCKGILNVFRSDAKVVR